jgi:hypothetical protein
MMAELELGFPRDAALKALSGLGFDLDLQGA